VGELRDEEIRERLAEWVRPAASWPVPDVRGLRHRARRRRIRTAAFGAAGVTAAAAMALVLALVLAAPTGGGRSSPVSPPPASVSWYPAGPLPAADAAPSVAPYVVTIAFQYAPAPAVVTNAFTGRVLARVRAPEAGEGFVEVAAAGDDRTFVLAEPSGTEHTWFYELRLRADGRLESLTRLFRAPPVGSFAVSPDASRLAYTMSGELRVVSLATGASRYWRVARGDALTAPSWTSDQKLAFYLAGGGSPPGIRLLDTAAPDRGLAASRLVVPVPAHTAFGDFTAFGDMLITPDGSKLFVTAIFDETASGSSVEVVEFSVRTGRALAVVTPRVGESGHGTSCLPLWTDPSGRQLTAECGGTGTIEDGRFTAVRLYVPAYNFSTSGNAFIAW
jgi:hypothetical protein